MWNKFFGLIKLVYDYGEDTKKSANKIKDLEAISKEWLMV